MEGRVEGQRHSQVTLVTTTLVSGIQNMKRMAFSPSSKITTEERENQFYQDQGKPHEKTLNINLQGMQIKIIIWYHAIRIRKANITIWVSMWGNYTALVLPVRMGNGALSWKTILWLPQKATHSHHHMIWHAIPTPKEEIWERYIYSMFTKASFPVIKM